MSQSAIQAAIQQICQEKNLAEESVVRTIELALAAAYRKDFGNKLQNIVTNFDPKTGETKVFDVKTVVEDLPEEEAGEATAETEAEAAYARPASEAFVMEDEGELVKKFNPRTEIQLKEAVLIDSKYKIGDEITTPLEIPGDFGRMAAQTAKQVIIQKIREEERQMVFEEYKAFEHQVVNGTISRHDGRNVLVDLGHAIAIMPPEEQLETERYSVGNRLKVYLRTVEQTSRGPQLIVSRTHNEVIKKIFELEIPEVNNGLVEIKSIAREPGNRAKVAIHSTDESIDPIGSCVGQRGSRIQTIIAELNNEKIDIILWDEDPAKFITNALSPAKVLAVELNSEQKVALVKVRDDQLSLAIGRGGQNVRLASKLTGWKIDIISEAGEKPGIEQPEAVDSEASEEKPVVSEEPVSETGAKEAGKKVKKKKKTADTKPEIAAEEKDSAAEPADESSEKAKEEITEAEPEFADTGVIADEEKDE
jgi:N utilization substance protein A